MHFEMSDQFWLSVLVQLAFGIAILAMMKQQLRDLVGWVRSVQADVKDAQADIKDHEGRISHVEGRLNVMRGEQG